MALPSVLTTGHSAMTAAKANIATTGHNIANATTEGFSRQRVEQEAEQGRNSYGKNIVGQGVRVARTERLNDLYLEKQMRNANRDLAHAEEKDMALHQAEDIFNEMGGDGLNRLISRFYNEFRKLSNDPDSESVRQSVREATQAMANDFRRIRLEVQDVAKHIDSRIEGHVKEVNDLAGQVRQLNEEIFKATVSGASPNDLLDRRDLALKKLGSYMDLNMHQDEKGRYIVEIKNVGPLVVGPNVETFSTQRTPKGEDNGKPENSVDIKTSASATSLVTHRLEGGKIGALVDVRDNTLTTILNRLDDLAYGIATSVNQVHQQGYTRDGLKGVNFFKQPVQRDRAAEFLDLSDEIKSNVNYIATAAISDAPSDNRIALAVANLQGQKLMNNGSTTVDDYYNSIVADVGVASSRNRSSMTQAKDIATQLSKFREHYSGVSIDEEVTNLMQFQNAFAASAKVIQVADEMLKTVLEIKR